MFEREEIFGEKFRLFLALALVKLDLDLAWLDQILFRSSTLSLLLTTLPPLLSLILIDILTQRVRLSLLPIGNLLPNQSHVLPRTSVVVSCLSRDLVILRVRHGIFAIALAHLFLI